MDTYTQNLAPPGSPHDTFYRDPTILAAFRNYAYAVVSRYSNSTAILAWELANEVHDLHEESS